MFQHHYASVILCSVGKATIFEHGCYIPALKQVRMLILNSYVLLACINVIYKYGHAWDDLVRCLCVSIFELRSSKSEI